MSETNKRLKNRMNNYIIKGKKYYQIIIKQFHL